MGIEDLLWFDGLVDLAMGDTPLVFLLKADFNGPDIAAGSVPASLGAPYVSVGGPLTFIQNDGNYSINSNRLYFTSQTTPAIGDLKVYKNGISRTPGVAAFARSLTSSVAVQWAGFRDENHASGGVNVVARTIYITSLSHQYVGPTPSGSTYILNLTAAVQATEYEFYWVLRKMGAFLFLGTQLALVVDGGTTNPVQAFHESYNSNGYVNTLRVADLPANGYGVFDHRDLDVTASIASPVQNSAFTHTADFVCRYSVVTVSAVDVINVLFHGFNDINNSVIVQITTTGGLILFDNGSNKASAGAGTVINGSTLSVLKTGSLYRVFVDGLLKISATISSNPGTGTSGGIRSIGSGGALANLTARTLDGQYTYPWESEELLVDGDMEAADTSAWVSVLSTVTKETSNPHGGNRVLRVVKLGSGGRAEQVGILIAGKTYRVHGWARGDGVSTAPSVRVGGGSGTWNGTASTSWQEVDLEVIADGTDLEFHPAGAIGAYAEYDDFSAIEVNSNRSDNNPGYGLATAVLPGPRAVNDTFTHEADCIIEFTVDAIPTAGGLRVNFRMQDATNYWWLVIGSTGALVLYERVGGADTLRGTASAGLSGGERIIIIASDTTIKGYYGTTLAWTYASATNFKTKTSGKIDTLDGGSIASNLIAWPLNFESAPNTGGAEDALEAFTRMGE